jgi:hypothetical protein
MEVDFEYIIDLVTSFGKKALHQNRTVKSAEHKRYHVQYTVQYIHSFFARLVSFGLSYCYLSSIFMATI